MGKLNDAISGNIPQNNPCPSGFFLSGIRIRCTEEKNSYFCDIQFICMPEEELRKRLSYPPELVEEAEEALTEKLRGRRKSKKAEEEAKEEAEESAEEGEKKEEIVEESSFWRW